MVQLLLKFLPNIQGRMACPMCNGRGAHVIGGLLISECMLCRGLRFVDVNPSAETT